MGLLRIEGRMERSAVIGISKLVTAEGRQDAWSVEITLIGPDVLR